MSHSLTDTERRATNLEKLVQVTRSLRAAFDLESLLDQIIAAVVELVGCTHSSILLADPRTGELHFTASNDPGLAQFKGITVPAIGSIAGEIAVTRQPLIVNDAQSDPRFFHQVDHASGTATETLIGVPMEIGGRVIGVLEAVNKRTGERFDEEDAQTLLMFAPQAAAAIENTRLIEEQQQRLAESALVQEAVLTLSRFIQMDQLLNSLFDLLDESLGYGRCAVWRAEQDHERMCVVAARGLPGQGPEGPNLDGSGGGQRSLKAQEAVIHLAATRREAINVPDISQDPTVSPISLETRSMAIVPMLCGDDIVGVLSVENEQANAFSERDMRILFSIALQTAIGIRQAELYETSLRANRLKQEFIATMSHELRTPMTVIISSCDMLLNKALGPVNEAQSTTLKTAIDRANLLLRLLNDVLDFSKIASGDLKLFSVLVNLPQAIESAVRKYQVYADRKRQRISVQVPPECLHVMADDSRLRQVLGHLLDNAIKFSPNERPVQIRASLHDADYIRVDVTDQGIGIRPQDLGQLFEDFRQLDSSFTREYGGAGLGLAMSRHLIELQGGMIWAESEFGRGSTFSFILPRPKPSPGQTLIMRSPFFPKTPKDKEI